MTTKNLMSDQDQKSMDELRTSLNELTVQVALLVQATRNLDQTDARLTSLERSKAFAQGAVWAVGLLAGTVGGVIYSLFTQVFSTK